MFAAAATLAILVVGTGSTAIASPQNVAPVPVPLVGAISAPQVVWASSATSAVTVNCPPGKVVIGGGAEVTGVTGSSGHLDGPTALKMSEPTGPGLPAPGTAPDTASPTGSAASATGWFAAADAGGVRAYAICASPFLTVRTPAGSTSLPGR